jgi:TP901 family phage tail tape measure protein
MDKKYNLSVIFRVLDQVSGPIQRIGNRFKNLIRPLNAAEKRFRKLGETVRDVGRKMSDVGKSLSLRLTLPLAAFAGLALRSSMKFNEAMANVATLIPENVERLNELKDAASKSAYAVGISSGIVAEGLYQIISFLGDSADTAKILDINSRAAAAGLATVKDAVDLTSAVMKGYQDISAETAQKTADLAFQTVKLGATTFPELASAMRGPIAWAAQLGLEVEELFAAFATLAGQTGTTAEVGTQLEAIMRALVKTTPGMKKAIEALGYESAKTMISERGLSASLKALTKYTGGSEEAMTKLFGRAEPLIAIFSLTGKLSKVYAERLAATAKVSGEMEEAFYKQTKGINRTGFAWKQFKVRLEDMLELWGDALSPTFEKILGLLDRIIHRFGRLSKSTKILIMVIGSLVAIMGPLLMIFGPIVAALGSILVAMTALSMIGVPALMSLLSSLIALFAPIVAVTAFFIALGVAIISVAYHFKKVTKFIQKWGAVLILILGLLAAPISAVVAGFALVASAAFTIMKKWKPIRDFFVDLFGFVNESIQETIDMLAKMLPDWLKKKIGLGFLISKKEEFVVPEKKRIAASEKIFSRFITTTQNSQADVNIKVSSDERSTATVEGVKTRGDSRIKINLATTGYLGAY